MICWGGTIFTGRSIYSHNLKWYYGAVERGLDMTKIVNLGKANPKTSRMFKRGYTVSLPLAKTAKTKKEGK
jgi:hypothetical protein